MKTKTLITAGFMMLIATSGFSQKDSSGIYFTANDYINHKLSYEINCKTEKHTINPDNIFQGKYVIIKHQGIKHKHLKDSVYAVKYCDESTTRIINGREYPLLNPGEQIMVYKMVSEPSGKQQSVKTVYYFSKDAQSNIQELTIYNIKAAFPDNHKFHDLVDMEFHSNDELTAYDSFHKIMKINRVFQNSHETK